MPSANSVKNTFKWQRFGLVSNIPQNRINKNTFTNYLIVPMNNKLYNKIKKKQNICIKKVKYLEVIITSTNAIPQEIFNKAATGNR